MIKETSSKPAASTKPRLIGYMRVSRSRQRTARQEDALAAAKCAKIFSDKISGKKWARVGLDAALSAIRPGDKLAVDAVDRLGRSALEILTMIAQLHNRGASLISLSQGCDSATQNGYVQMLFHAVFAEIEHNLILHRTRAGVRASMASGNRRGGKPKMTAEQTSKARRLIERGVSADVVAARYNVGRSTLFRHLKAERGRARML